MVETFLETGRLYAIQTNMWLLVENLKTRGVSWEGVVEGRDVSVLTPLLGVTSPPLIEILNIEVIIEVIPGDFVIPGFS